jgi:hypothetical protein
MQIFRLLRFGCSLLLLASLVRAHRDTYAPVTSDDLLGQQRSEVQPLAGAGMAVAAPRRRRATVRRVHASR